MPGKWEKGAVCLDELLDGRVLPVLGMEELVTQAPEESFDRGTAPASWAGEGTYRWSRELHEPDIIDDGTGIAACCTDTGREAGVF